MPARAIGRGQRDRERARLELVPRPQRAACANHAFGGRRLGVVEARERLVADDGAGAQVDERLEDHRDRVVGCEQATICSRCSSPRTNHVSRSRLARPGRAAPRRSSFASKSWKQPLPPRLAAYIARSARRSTSSTPLTRGSPSATPTLGLEEDLLAMEDERLAEAAEDPLRRLHHLVGPSTSSSRTPNSSPPRRATVSAERSAAAQPAGDADEQLVAAAWPVRSLISLEVVEVDEEHARRAARRGARARARARCGRRTARGWPAG